MSEARRTRRRGSADEVTRSNVIEVDGAASSGELQALSASTTQRSSVLVVDDDEEFARGLARWLTTGPHDVQIAHRAYHALELIDEHEFDVILTDVNMPGLSGLELLGELRRCGREVPVIVVTASPALETAVRAMNFGANGYLTKPVKFEAVTDAIARASAQARLARVRRVAMERLAQDELAKSKRSELERQFRSALAGLWIAFQPIVDTATQRVIAYEALMRSREPALPHPGAVLDAADQLQSIHVLGRTTRALTAAALAALPEPTLCFVNLHVLDLADPELFEPGSPLSAYASRVVLELTERASGEMVANIRERIARLRAMGFRVAIDDLGAGYAGLQYFTQLGPDFAKIDMSIIRGIDSDPARQKIVVALVTLCRQLGVTVIAEGIETAEERDALVAIGCDAMQGYRFGRPGEGFAAARW